MFPISKTKYDAKLLPKEEISIMKLMPPIGKLFHLEYHYEPLLKIKNERIDKRKK